MFETTIRQLSLD